MFNFLPIILILKAKYRHIYIYIFKAMYVQWKKFGKSGENINNKVKVTYKILI